LFGNQTLVSNITISQDNLDSNYTTLDSTAVAAYQDATELPVVVVEDQQELEEVPVVVINQVVEEEVPIVAIIEELEELPPIIATQDLVGQPPLSPVVLWEPDSGCLEIVHDDSLPCPCQSEQPQVSIRHDNSTLPRPGHYYDNNDGALYLVGILPTEMTITIDYSGPPCTAVLHGTLHMDSQRVIPVRVVNHLDGTSTVSAPIYDPGVYTIRVSLCLVFAVIDCSQCGG